MNAAPAHFTIRPDDYHVPYAGTAEDGRKFFITDGLFSGTSSWVGLFMWNEDGSFDEVRLSAADRPASLPPGQAAPAAIAGVLVDTRLAELGTYVREPITVQPFLTQIDGIDFGWRLVQYEDDTHYISIEPGDFICYYEPWDGEDYET